MIGWVGVRVGAPIMGHLFTVGIKDSVSVAFDKNVGIHDPISDKLQTMILIKGHREVEGQKAILEMSLSILGMSLLITTTNQHRVLVLKTTIQSMMKKTATTTLTMMVFR